MDDAGTAGAKASGGFAGKFKASCTQSNESTYTTSAIECSGYLRVTRQVPFTFHKPPATWANHPIDAILVYSPEEIGTVLGLAGRGVTKSSRYTHDAPFISKLNIIKQLII